MKWWQINENSLYIIYNMLVSTVAAIESGQVDKAKSNCMRSKTIRMYSCLIRGDIILGNVLIKTTHHTPSEVSRREPDVDKEQPSGGAWSSGGPNCLL